MAHRYIRDRELGKNRATQQHIDDQVETDYGPDSRPNRTATPTSTRPPAMLTARGGSTDDDMDAQSSVQL